MRSTMAMRSGALVAAYVVLDAGREVAVHRVADLDHGQLGYAYDLNTLGFTNVWLAVGSFAFACGWVVVSTDAMPRWLGWWSIVSGIGARVGAALLDGRGGLARPVRRVLALAPHDMRGPRPPDPERG